MQHNHVTRAEVSDTVMSVGRFEAVPLQIQSVLSGSFYNPSVPRPGLESREYGSKDPNEELRDLYSSPSGVMWTGLVWLRIGTGGELL
jgi:hypothetical protein